MEPASGSRRKRVLEAAAATRDRATLRRSAQVIILADYDKLVDWLHDLLVEADLTFLRVARALEVDLRQDPDADPHEWDHIDEHEFEGLPEHISVYFWRQLAEVTGVLTDEMCPKAPKGSAMAAMAGSP